MAKKKEQTGFTPIVNLVAEIGFNKKYSPSTFVSYDEVDAYRASMSCGGGMGGARWDELITEDIPCGSGEQVIERTDVYGKKLKINTRWVVKSEKIRVGIYLEDITEWAKIKGKELNGKKMFYKCIFYYDPSEFQYSFDDSSRTDVEEIKVKGTLYAKTYIA